MNSSHNIKQSVKNKTLFNYIEYNFPDVDKENIETQLFLNAATEVVELIVLLGKIFASVKYDMNNNIEKINSVYEKDKDKNKYLYDLILNEKARNENLATNGLLWLRRTLHFVSRFFECIVESHKSNIKTKDLEKYLNIAYTETLMPFHKWISQQLFNILLKTKWTSKEFFKILANNKNVDFKIIINDMEIFNINLKKCVLNLYSFYMNNQLENIDRM